MDNYRDKIICAPMVRVSTLPFRLLALDYGADLVYSEELVDRKLIQCKRIENSILETVDFIDEDNVIIFRTVARERSKLIAQLGTSDPVRALQAARIVEKDVSGIDINCGCPKSFSLKGGMGAALLSQPDKLKAILTHLVKNLSIPVTCKIRVLPDLQQTLELVQVIQETGIAALAVHGRTKDERPQHANRNDYIREIAKHIKIPLIANGGSRDICCYQDLLRFKESTNASSVMIARAAEQNCSIFRREGKLEIADVITAFLRYSVRYWSYTSSIKYTLSKMFHSDQAEGIGRETMQAPTLKEIFNIWKLGDECENESKRQATIAGELKRGLSDGDDAEIEMLLDSKKKRMMLQENGDVENKNTERIAVRYISKLFKEHRHLPKNILHRYLNSRGQKAIFHTQQIQKDFHSVCEIDGKRYTTLFMEKNKRFAEQAAALVACAKLLLINDQLLQKCMVD